MRRRGILKVPARVWALCTAACLTAAGILGNAAGFTEGIITEAEELDLKGLDSFSLRDVTLTDEYYVHATQLEIDYLLSFDTDRLLAGFRENAGLDMRGASRYGGWENSLIGGHTLGHYMTALVQAYESAGTDDEDRAALLSMIETLTDGLKECQDAGGTGFIFGATLTDSGNVEKQFDNVESGRCNITTEAWVPWYTMHKIIAGLVSVAEMQEDLRGRMSEEEARKVMVVSDEATAVLSNLGDWVYGRTSSWSDSVRTTVLSIEYGGMNDCMYDVYLLTGREEHRLAAEAFCQDTLYEAVAGAQPGDNVLDGLHANTTIPKFLGAMKRYLVTGEEEYLRYAESFWDLVTEDHTYITGGNSEWEHFGKDDILDAERTGCNCETCNSYNMLKLTSLLFKATGNVKYADWYENTVINSVLSSQNPETGMTTYFQPMAGGYFKVFGTQFTKFWCCTGSGMENFTKLAGDIYYHKDGLLVVSRYVSSELNAEGFHVSVEASVPASDTVKLTVLEDYDGRIAFRLPDYLTGQAVITVNGKTADYEIIGADDGALTAGSVQNLHTQGMAVLDGGFKSGDVVNITLPMGVTAYNLPDGENTYAFKYGPVVLSALLGDEDLTTSVTGVDVTVPAEKYFDSDILPSESEKITILEGSIEEFMDGIDSHLVREGDGLSFTLEGTDAALTFVPHYSQYTQRYGIYFKFTDDHSALDAQSYVNELKQARMDAFLLDTVQPGYGQYENDSLHHMTEGGTGSVGQTEKGTSRYALKDGSFTYTMLVDNENGTDLILYLNPSDAGKTIVISSAEQVIAELTVAKGEDPYEVLIPIEAETLRQLSYENEEGQTVIDLTFAGKNAAESASLWDFVYTMRHMDDDVSLLDAEISEGALYYSESEGKYLAIVPEGAAAQLSFTLPAEYAYLTVREASGSGTTLGTCRTAVPADASAVSLELFGDRTFTGYELTVYAQDHVHTKTYEVLVSSDREALEKYESIGTGDIAYFVDCGDHDTTTVSEGESLGSFQSLTEQLWGADPVTGRFWGLQDDEEDAYAGAGVSGGIYTAHTWCYEFNVKDGLRKTVTNRYTKNQYESGIDRHLNYAFELADGTYEIEMCFADPWGCSKNPTVTAYAGEENEQVLFYRLATEDGPVTSEVKVSGGMLDLTITSADKAINLNYILLRPKDAQPKDHSFVLISGTAPVIENGAEASLETEEAEPVSEDQEAGGKHTGLIIGLSAAALAAVAAGLILIFKRKK